MIRALFAVSLALALAACATAPKGPPRLVAEAASWMTGTWSSAEQSKADPVYLSITTHILPVPAPPGADAEEVWLYSQSLRPDQPGAPYRANMVRLTLEDGEVLARQYRVLDSKPYAAAIEAGAALPGVERANLKELDGCDLRYRRTRGNEFFGQMKERACRNTFRGADWLDARAVLREDSLMTWDRGFKDDGTFVWGPQKGGYQFRRIR